MWDEVFLLLYFASKFSIKEYFNLDLHTLK